MTYPGSYGLQEGERLSSVLRRAGGLRDTALPQRRHLDTHPGKGIRGENQKRTHSPDRDLLGISTPAGANLGSGQEQAALAQAAARSSRPGFATLEDPTGEADDWSFYVSADINSWANTPADIEMHTGDVLTLPKRPGFVLVSGQVYNASALTYVPGKEAGWYLRRAGGTNEVANRKEILVIRANGSVIGRRSGEWYGPDVLSTHLEPGDVIVVPQKIIGGSLFWKNLLTIAQISSSIAFTAGIAGVL